MALTEPGADRTTEDPHASGRMKRMRLRQLRSDARARAAEAQDATVRAVQRNARYALWLIAIAAISCLIGAAAVAFEIWTTVTNSPS
jgi:hypothetical protein